MLPNYVWCEKTNAGDGVKFEIETNDEVLIDEIKELIKWRKYNPDVECRTKEIIKFAVNKRDEQIKQELNKIPVRDSLIIATKKGTHVANLISKNDVIKMLEGK